MSPLGYLKQLTYTSGTTMALKLQWVLNKFSFIQFFFAYMKDEGSNLQLNLCGYTKFRSLVQ
jgi:hypothetical protein